MSLILRRAELNKPAANSTTLVANVRELCLDIENWPRDLSKGSLWSLNDSDWSSWHHQLRTLHNFCSASHQWNEGYWLNFVEPNDVLAVATFTTLVEVLQLRRSLWRSKVEFHVLYERLTKKKHWNFFMRKWKTLTVVWARTLDSRWKSLKQQVGERLWCKRAGWCR